MFERLRRAVGGSGPPTHALDAFEADTPHRFATWLARHEDRDQVDAALAGAKRLPPLTVTPVDEPDGRVRLEFVVGPARRLAALQGPLDALDAAGIEVRGFVAHDLVTDIDDRELKRTVEAHEAAPGRDGAPIRRLEALAGEDLLARSLAGLAAASRRHSQHNQWRTFAWRDAAASVCLNTPGSERVLIEQVATVTNDDTAYQLLNTATARIRLSHRVGVPFEVPEASLLTAMRGGSQLTESAIGLIRTLPDPPSGAVVEALCRIIRRKGHNATSALLAIRRVPMTPAIRRAVESALDAKDTDVPGVALTTLAEMIGTEARPHWNAFLESRSANRRLDAEWAIGHYGDADDVATAAAGLHKLIRSKLATETEPPRASNFIELLTRHADLPAAQAALADVTARWAKLTPDLQRWIERHRPELMSASASAPPRGTEPAPAEPLQPEPTLMWPMPTIERKGDQVHLAFDDMDHDVQDRFYDLLAAHDRFTSVDGDREWQDLKTDLADPESVIADLWARAHEPPAG